MFKNLYRKIIPQGIRKKIYLYRHPLSTYVNYRIRRQANKEVVSGPFKGMKFSMDYDFLPMLLGTYELEIHPVFDKLKSYQFDQIINIGASGGYYAVGLALLWPKANIYAFEKQISAYYKRILNLAKKNLVSDRVYIRGTCEISDLISLLQPNKSTLLMLDVDGAEIDLLNPLVVPKLRQTTIIVELHDIFIPGCSMTIQERFQNSHNIEKYTTRLRRLEDFPIQARAIINFFTRRYVVNTMAEGRPGQQDYFLMTPFSLSERVFNKN